MVSHQYANFRSISLQRSSLRSRCGLGTNSGLLCAQFFFNSETFLLAWKAAVNLPGSLQHFPPFVLDISYPFCTVKAACSSVGHWGDGYGVLGWKPT